MKTVNILGVEYRLEIHKISEDKSLKENGWAGYCDEDSKLIVVADLDDDENFVFEDDKAQDEYFRRTLRHEIVHAFLNESGLSYSSMSYSSAWAKNEEMVDWIAIQFPKILKVFEELEVLE